MRRLAGHGASVTRVRAALIDDFEALGREALRERVADSIDRIHAGCLKFRLSSVNELSIVRDYKEISASLCRHDRTPIISI
jgi:hypothetical protein